MQVMNTVRGRIKAVAIGVCAVALSQIATPSGAVPLDWWDKQQVITDGWTATTTNKKGPRWGTRRDATLTGLSTEVSLGTIIVGEEAIILIQGLSLTTEQGSLGTSADAGVELSGFAVTVTLGDIPDMSLVQGGSSTGEATIVYIPGVSATASQGSLAMGVVADGTVTFSGLGTTMTLGAIVLGMGEFDFLQGLSAATAINRPTMEAGATVALSGLATTATIGNLTTSEGVFIYIPGFALAASLGTVTARTGVEVELAGLGATASINGIATASQGEPVLGTCTAEDGQVCLAWDLYASDTSVLGFKLYYGIVSGAYTVVDVIPGWESVTHTVTGLTNGATYYFVLTAYDATSESGYSNEVSTQP